MVALTVSVGFLSNTSFGSTFGETPEIIRYNSPPTLIDVSGQATETIQVGQQGMIRVSLRNIDSAERSLVIIVEVRDARSITQHLSYQNYRIAGNGDYTFDTLWRPDGACQEGVCDKYQFRSFVISDLEAPQLLSTVNVYEGVTLINSSDGKKIYNLAIGGNVYEIEYYIGSGFVKSVGVYSEPATLEAVLDEVNKETILIIRLSQTLVIEAFSCVEEPALEVGKPIVFVDSTETAALVDLHNDESMTLEIPLNEGSENVEILGRCLM